VLYVGTQLASSLMMSSPTMDKTQRRIMLFMPLFFVIFIISFPAGVIVYWITTNSWTILQQWIVKKRVGHIGPLPAVDASAAGASGGGGRDGANGAAGGGLGALLRGRKPAEEERETVGAGARARTKTAAPPPPPRKKKKRSGRRR
jgi:YidC/Oxa1 family membrane protein insertase